MTTTIRRMLESDREAVLGLLGELTDHEATLSDDRATGPAAAAACLADDTEKATEHGGGQFVAEMDGRAIGYLALRLGRTGPFLHDHLRDHVYIENIVVAAARRGTGVGQMLLARAELFAREAGCKALHLGVLTGNDIALNAYRRAGFKGFALEMAKIID
ncbi:GNAT family N-acetyltransferase [Bosea sp. AAP35]|uniref:GNAT family N-acetyltransferase n=1 Tax=Bosea sp. AAP35 TaxID=1523417 RepID=UPI000AD4C727|nr:GNAT family N-acetyltransferase [Bosea sp. AAP35]